MFDHHGEPLAFRHPANKGAAVVPARVTDDGKHIDILPGFTEVGVNGEPKSKVKKIVPPVTVIESV